SGRTRKIPSVPIASTHWYAIHGSPGRTAVESSGEVAADGSAATATEPFVMASVAAVIDATAADLALPSGLVPDARPDIEGLPARGRTTRAAGHRDRSGRPHEPGVWRTTSRVPAPRDTGLPSRAGIVNASSISPAFLRSQRLASIQFANDSSELS